MRDPSPSSLPVTPFDPSHADHGVRNAVFSIFFTVIAWAYYHQVLDPTSAANVSRAPANFASGAPGPYPYPDHYNRPYDADYSLPQYAPPPGPPPGGSYAPPPGPPPTGDYAPPPGPPPSDMDYWIGMGTGAANDVKSDSATTFDDPFADFDEPSKATTHTHPSMQ